MVERKIGALPAVLTVIAVAREDLTPGQPRLGQRSPHKVLEADSTDGVS